MRPRMGNAMIQTVTIDGHEIELQEIDPDEIVTDIMILRRTVHHDQDGDLEDAIRSDWTPNTTGIIRVGMAKFALDIERIVTDE